MLLICPSVIERKPADDCFSAQACVNSSFSVHTNKLGNVRFEVTVWLVRELSGV
jgi:hypothetical protein